MKRKAAEIVREYGPFPGVDQVGGVTYDGQNVWIAAGDKLTAFDPASGKTLRSIDVAARAGTAFDGRHLFQLADGQIQKIDPKTGRVLATIPSPGGSSTLSKTSPVRGSTCLNSLSSFSHVPCQSSPSTHVTPVTKRLDSIVRRILPVSGSS